MSTTATEGVAPVRAEELPVVVIGAGPAGLAAAEHVLDAGVPVVVVDGAPGVGGLSRSVELWGHRFDLGPHSFLSNSHPESVRRWLDLAGAAGGVERTEALRAAIWRGRVVGFPPGPVDVLRTAGVARTATMAATRATTRVRAKLRRASAEPRDAYGDAYGDAYAGLVAQHGRGVVEELFVPYCRKYLGVHPRDLSPAFADKLQGTRRGWNGPVELLTPQAGTGAVWDELARRLRARGARILLGTRVVGLVTDGSQITGVRVQDTAGESVLPVRALVSSAPAPVLLRWLPGTTMPTGPVLGSRDTYLVHLLLEGAPGTTSQGQATVGQDSHYVTAYDESVRIGRLTNTRSWRPEAFRDEQRTVLCAEFWSSGDDDLSARSNHELTKLAIAELPVFGVDPRVRVLDADVMRLPRSVPVLTRGVEDARAAVDAQLDRFTNLARVGRHGTHDWDGQEDSLLTGRSIGAHVLGIRA